jgi:hypothetical protein
MKGKRGTRTTRSTAKFSAVPPALRAWASEGRFRQLKVSLEHTPFARDGTIKKTSHAYCRHRFYQIIK